MNFCGAWNGTAGSAVKAYDRWFTCADKPRHSRQARTATQRARSRRHILASVCCSKLRLFYTFRCHQTICKHTHAASRASCPPAGGSRGPGRCTAPQSRGWQSRPACRPGCRPGAAGPCGCSTQQRFPAAPQLLSSAGSREQGGRWCEPAVGGAQLQCRAGRLRSWVALWCSHGDGDGCPAVASPPTPAAPPAPSRSLLIFPETSLPGSTPASGRPAAAAAASQPGLRGLPATHGRPGAAQQAVAAGRAGPVRA